MRRAKRKQAAVSAQAAATQIQNRSITERTGRPWAGLYIGDSAERDGTTPERSAGAEDTVLVVGPPRSGKTSTLVIPSVLDAPAAVVSTSTKADVVGATALRRYALGNCFVFDPSGTYEPDEGRRFLHRLRWSPVMGCADFEAAVATAHTLASAARPGSALTESAHWVERAEALLAPLLFAAAQRGADMETLCRWVLSRDLREPYAVLEELGHAMARDVLAGVVQTEDRERSGIFSSAAGLLAAYRSEAALAATRHPNFSPAAFAASTDALYICAPAHAQEQLAPLVVCLLEQIRRAVYARPADAAPVVFALDEVANIAPLPTLPAMAAEGAGRGLITLACLQDLSQARARWGAVADGFFSLFSHKIVFPGIGDHRTLSLISALAGDHQVIETSVSKTVGHYGRLVPTVTKSPLMRPRLPIDAVSRGRPGHVLVLSGSDLYWHRVVHWRDHPRWSDVASRMDPCWNERVRPHSLYFDESGNWA